MKARVALTTCWIMSYEIVGGILKTLRLSEIHQKALLIRIKDHLLVVQSRAEKATELMDKEPRERCSVRVDFPNHQWSIFSLVPSIQNGPDLDTKKRGLVRSQRPLRPSIINP